MTVESLNDFNNESNEKLSDSEKIKNWYDTLCTKIGELNDCSYIDEDGYKVTLLSPDSKLPEEYRKISKFEKGIIVIKENMNTGNCYITNVFCDSIKTGKKSSQKITHKRGIISWIQKSKGGSTIGVNHNGSGTVSVFYDGEVAGFEKLDNLSEKDVSQTLAKIYKRYLDIKIPSHQKTKKMKIMLDRVENNIRENDADEFLDQALENLA